MRYRACLLSSLVLLATCTTPEKLPEAPVVAVPEGPGAWTLDTAADGLKARSCPDGTAYTDPTPLAVTATPIALGPADEVAERLPEGVTFAGGWQLTADNKSFGGLSDLALDKDGNLLAVVDDGTFVWIGLSNGAPDGTGGLAYMLGADGQLLQGKTLGDAEGLSIRDGLAVVSFERTHRVSAFALDACGAAAREAEISPLPDTWAGRKVDENSGAEALTITPDGNILFGFETVENGVSPVGAITGPDQAGWTGETAPNPPGYAFVGFDTVDAGGADATYWLFRSYDPIRGSRNVLSWNGGKTGIVLTKPLVTDNYEGITAEDLGNGVTRIWIVSDDNFNPKQRTLLLAFDIAAPSE